MTYELRAKFLLECTEKTVWFLKRSQLITPGVFREMSASGLFQPRRSSFGGFGSLRRRRQDDGEDYICPMNVEMPKSSSFQRNVHIYEETLGHLEQVGVFTAVILDGFQKGRFELHLSSC